LEERKVQPRDLNYQRKQVGTQRSKQLKKSKVKTKFKQLKERKVQRRELNNGRKVKNPEI